MHRILFYESRYFSFYGAQRNLYLLLRELDRTRFEPLVMCPGEGYFTKRVRELGMPVYIVQPPQILDQYGKRLLYGPLHQKLWAGANLLVYNVAIGRAIHHAGIDLVYCNDIRDLLTIGLAAKALRRPLVWYLQLDVSLGLFDRIGLHLADRVVTISDSVRSMFRKKDRIFYEAKFLTIPSGVDLMRFAPRGRRADARAELRLESGEIALGVVASLTPRKGQAELLQAVGRLKDTYPQVRVIVIGDSPPGEDDYAIRLRRIVTELGLEERVQFLGWRDDVPYVMEGLDIFVLSSYHEGLPGAVQEAMAMCLPVVATDAGGMPELIDDGVTGLIVPKGDVDALAEVIAAMLADPARWIAMGRAGRRHVETHFSVEAMAHRFEALFESLIAGPAPVWS